MKATLGFIALAAMAGLLLGVTRALTSERIAANQSARDDAIIQDILGTTNTTSGNAASRLCRTSVRGYAGAIELLVLPSAPHADPAQPMLIEAVRILQHRETPGIGDFITTDNSPWILGFTGLQLEQAPRNSAALWHQQLDAVSGATITRRAVIRGVASACEASS